MSREKILRIGALVSGGGTNLQKIIDAIDEGQISHAEVVTVVSNKPEAYALERAELRGIEAICLQPKLFEERSAYDEALVKHFKERQVDLIVMAGFLVVVGQGLVEAFPNQIMNIHPSLIPAFCGDGYYGIRVHQAVLQHGVKVTGATVHFVDVGTDTGPIILQKAVEVRDDDTAEVLQQRVMEEAEWEIYPRAIGLFAQGKLRVEGRNVRRI